MKKINALLILRKTMKTYQQNTWACSLAAPYSRSSGLHHSIENIVNSTARRRRNSTQILIRREIDNRN
jgi:hypothetical protein